MTRILAFFVCQTCTEWCRVEGSNFTVGGNFTVGVLEGRAIANRIKQELDRAPGSEEEPIFIVVGGSVSKDHKASLTNLVELTPGTEIAFCQDWEVVRAMGAARRIPGQLAQTMREHGLISAKAPARWAAAMALDMAQRLSS